jgi:large subunit ribosomal protein L1
MGKGKKYNAALQKYDRQKRYSVQEAVGILSEIETATYDETVEVAVSLGVNPKHADQMVRGAVVLPHGTGKVVRVAVFAKGDKEKEALDAGADFVGAEDLVAKIKGGWFDFDTAIATPNMMVHVGKIGRVLGPRGLMPNPKVGTVTFDITKAVTQAKAGKIAYRTDRTGIIHAGIGKRSFEAAKLVENLNTLLETLAKAKPSSAKGRYFKGVTISLTHSPGVRIDANEIANQYRV